MRRIVNSGTFGKGLRRPGRARFHRGATWLAQHLVRFTACLAVSTAGVTMTADLYTLAIEHRPENRRRRAEASQLPVWEQPRSEAFFEDLDPAPALQVMPHPAQSRPNLPLAA
jgi:hypothetical protein